MKPNILILDDEPGICTFLSISLESTYHVHIANTPAQAYEIIESKDIRLLLLDLVIGKFSGMEVLCTIKSQHPEIVVIMMTAFGNISSSVDAIKAGAYNYLTKPLNLDELQIFISQALEFQSLNRKVEYLSEELGIRNSYWNMVGKSYQMQRVYKLVEKVRDIDTSIIITGESGTGKELVARAIHFSGARREQPFICVNCAAIPAGLLEEEFFGHKKGSFTGAFSDKLGKLELADKGTLFLDEIGDLPMELQGKLLRVLQEKETVAIGGKESKHIDVRFVSATNMDLWSMVQKGKFRQDLYYRLNVLEIPMPPLRERKQDIPLLCEQFVAKLSKEKDLHITGMTKRAEALLLQYSFPGNVRELVNAIEYAMILCDSDIIDADDFPPGIRYESDVSDTASMDIEKFARAYLSGVSIKDMERILLKINLEQNPQSRRAVAKILGISERALFYKIQEYGL
ncbi:MAG TPA: sigma-54 dependent transcriptional regulator [Negativicutes bacterium]|nr:sigma-54 dependent transcriptional regulator [Negativicutes bacterium]